MATRAFVYSRGQAVNFTVDNMLNNLKEIIRETGLDPAKLMDDSELIKRGLRTWIESGHLEKVTIQFYAPGSSAASAQWDFPISQQGSGVDDDMWADKSYLRNIVAKSRRPNAGDVYTVSMRNKPGWPHVDGFRDCELKSTSHMTAVNAGTVISTNHVTAGAVYWR